MNGGSVVASLPLTSPLITPSTGEAEPRGSTCVLYDTYNTFCTIHIRNLSNGTNEWASVVCGKVQVVHSIFLPFPLSVYPWREDPTSVASLPLTSPLIMPSTGEAEPRGSSCVLYDTYNAFCTIHILNVLNATHEWALAPAQVFVSARKVELFENPTSIRPL